MTSLFQSSCRPPWLVARFAAPWRMASWSLNRPGLVLADTVAWLHVAEHALTPATDPMEFLTSRLAEAGLREAVGLMTARDVRYHRSEALRIGEARAHCLVTAGLTNAVDIAGARTRDAGIAPGTINLLVAVSVALTDGALLEAISIAAEARTAALIDQNARTPAGDSATGTGTDCIVVACPPGESKAAHAGLHTDAGIALGRCVFRATAAATADWMAGLGYDTPGLPAG